MGGLILIFLLGLLLAILILPAARQRLVRKAPPEGTPPEPSHEVVHRLDDHRKKSAEDDAQKR